MWYDGLELRKISKLLLQLKLCKSEFTEKHINKNKMQESKGFQHFSLQN